MKGSEASVLVLVLLLAATAAYDLAAYLLGWETLSGVVQAFGRRHEWAGPVAGLLLLLLWLHLFAVPK